MKLKTDNNFWKENSLLTMATGLDTLYNEDKSKGKEKSSKVMWAIYLSEHPDSDYYNHPNKREEILKMFLKDDKFKWEQYEKEIEYYRQICLTPAERALTIWNETMTLRNTSLKKMYQEALENKDVDELVKLDKMLSLTPKMFDDYKKILADYNEEQTKSSGKRKSLSDSGEI